MKAAFSREVRGPVMMDVASRARVSQKTVSRVINEAPNVRPEVRDRVRAAIRELGYRPNRAARALVTQRTHVIGVVVVGTPQFGPSTRVFTLERAARAHGYELALASPRDTSPDEIQDAVESLLARGVEGIVLEVPTQLSVDPDLWAGVPITSNVGWIDGVQRQASIGFDQVGAGRLATDYLLDLGHRTVAHLAGPEVWDAARVRRQGWEMAHQLRQIPLGPSLAGDWSARSGYQAGVQLLGAHPDLTAVFAANDQMAIGLMRAATEAGLRIPDDISIIGMDDVPEAEFLMVPLTTLKADDAAISEAILGQLVAMIDSNGSGEVIVFSAEMVVRRSSGPPPGATPR